MRDSDIDVLSSDGAQESPPRLLSFDPPEDYKPYAVLMDVNRWDTDEGRAWITVNALGPLDAMRKVRELYPEAAVLRAEVAE